jgi:hypothetical protein
MQCTGTQSSALFARVATRHCMRKNAPLWVPVIAALCKDENGGSVLNKDEIREKYEEFVGTDRYLSLLATVQGSALRKGRLKYKQEIEWNKFITEYNLKNKRSR